MRLEPFITHANRSLVVFECLNNTLTILSSVVGQETPQNVVPANFSFFNKQFTRYAEMASTNTEVGLILRELCQSLERIPRQEQGVSADKRRSIMDPVVVKMTGQRTTTTSAKVNHSAPVQSTKMAEQYQTNVLGRTKKPAGAKRRHRCSICREEGHHPQTCGSLFAPENTERTKQFLKQLIEKNRVQSFLDVLTRRASSAFVRQATRMVEQLVSESQGGGSIQSGAH